MPRLPEKLRAYWFPANPTSRRSDIQTANVAGTIEADTSRAELWPMKADQKPSYRLSSLLLGMVKLDIPAGEAKVVQSNRFTLPLEAVAAPVPSVFPSLFPTAGVPVVGTLEG